MIRVMNWLLEMVNEFEENPDDKELQITIRETIIKTHNLVMNDYYSYFEQIALSDKFLLTFEDVLDLELFTAWCSRSISEDLLRYFSKSSKIDWDNILSNQMLSEDFIREYHKDMSWITISKTQILSENFIREFQDKLDWSYVSKLCNMSEDFILEFRHKINWRYIKLNKYVSKVFIDKILGNSEISENEYY